MSESVREVEVSGEPLSKSLSGKGNTWRRKDRAMGMSQKSVTFGTSPANLKLSLYNNDLILNIVSKSKGTVRFYLLTILRLKRQAAFSGIYRNIGLADESARKQLFGEFVFKFSLDSPL